MLKNSGVAQKNTKIHGETVQTRKTAFYLKDLQAQG